MKIKRGILGLLLSAFIFIAMHDFIIANIDPDTQVELYVHELKEASLCDSSNLHEHLHTYMMVTVDLSQYLNSFHKNLSLYFEDVDPYIYFNYNQLYRPPIV